MFWSQFQRDTDQAFITSLLPKILIWSSSQALILRDRYVCSRLLTDHNFTTVRELLLYPFNKGDFWLYQLSHFCKNILPLNSLILKLTPIKKYYWWDCGWLRQHNEKNQTKWKWHLFIFTSISIQKFKKV